MTTIRDDRIALFAKLQDPATQPRFWDRVADNVDWTVEGTHPLAGRYHHKAQFIESTFARLAGQAVPGGVKLEVTHLYVDGDTTIAELHLHLKDQGGSGLRQRLLLGVPLRGGHHRRGAGPRGLDDGGLHHPPQRRSTRLKREQPCWTHTIDSTVDDSGEVRSGRRSPALVPWRDCHRRGKSGRTTAKSRCRRGTDSLRQRNPFHPGEPSRRDRHYRGEVRPKLEVVPTSSRRNRNVEMDGDRSDWDRKPSPLSLEPQSSTGPDRQGRGVHGGESLNVKAFRRQSDIHGC